MTGVYSMVTELLSTMSWHVTAKAGLTPATQIRNQDVSAWLSLILAGRPWPAPRCAPRITSCDSFGGQYRYEPSPNILKSTP